jgi:hypothetical protein
MNSPQPLTENNEKGGAVMSRFIRGLIVTSAVGLALLAVSAPQSEAGPWRGYRGGYWGARPYVGVGVGVYPSYYGGYYGGGYAYPAYGYSYPAYYGGYAPGYGYGYGYPGVSVGYGYGYGRGYYGHYGRYGRWHR